MVAYSFQRRFALRIVDGSKTQTIRADRRRHARPGEMLQLFQGMRTSGCVKLIADPLCTSVDPVQIRFDESGEVSGIEIDGVPVGDPDAFALADGFESLSDMSGFWVMHHGLLREFRGVLIRWCPVWQSKCPLCGGKGWTMRRVEIPFIGGVEAVPCKCTEGTHHG